MANIMLRPDLKTTGGEVNDIVIDGKYCGNLVLAYREGHRLSGSAQLDRSHLSKGGKKQVVAYLRSYVQQLIDALRIRECDVIVTYSDYEEIIATEADVGVIRGFADEAWTAQAGDFEEPDILGDDYTEDPRFDEYEPDPDTYEMRQTDEGRGRRGASAGKSRREPEIVYAGGGKDDTLYYELVIVGESRGRVEYHVYDKDKNWIAEAFCKLSGPDVSGEIHWTDEPSEEEIDAVADLVVSDFDSEQIDTIELDMLYEGEVIETIELTHRDLLEEHESAHTLGGLVREASDEYTIVLARDDGDMLTYEIYQQSAGGLPIGTATVDISRRQLSGFIDFRDTESAEDRELIATLLMQELDKEKEYETLNLTMLHQNQPIDEILFETEQVH